MLGIYECVQQKLWLTGQYCVLDDLGYVTMYRLLAMNAILVMDIHVHVVCTE